MHNIEIHSQELGWEIVFMAECLEHGSELSGLIKVGGSVLLSGTTIIFTKKSAHWS
jgi:hypothetical protein